MHYLNCPFYCTLKSLITSSYSHNSTESIISLLILLTNYVFFITNDLCVANSHGQFSILILLDLLEIFSPTDHSHPLNGFCFQNLSTLSYFSFYSTSQYFFFSIYFHKLLILLLEFPRLSSLFSFLPIPCLIGLIQSPDLTSIYICNPLTLNSTQYSVLQSELI